MKAEQDYAINHYKGSGEMSDMLDEMKADAEKERATDKKSLADVNNTENKLKAKEITADKGETAIAGDSADMYAFSAFTAANAAAS